MDLPARYAVFTLMWVLLIGGEWLKQYKGTACGWPRNKSASMLHDLEPRINPNGAALSLCQFSEFT